MPKQPRRGVAGYENRHQKVIPLADFAQRLLRAVLLWLAMTLVGLAIGMAGYALTEGMSLIDAFVNAAMILSGMGPVAELKTGGGKLFAGIYAIMSGLFLVVATGFVLAPVLHRILHVLHVERGRDEGS
jgi:hypothetical protein